MSNDLAAASTKHSDVDLILIRSVVNGRRKTQQRETPMRRIPDEKLSPGGAGVRGPM